MSKYGRIIALVLTDAVLFNISYFLSYLIRAEFNIHQIIFEQYFPIYVDNLVVITLIKIAVYYAAGLYKRLWRYAGSEELLRIVFVGALASLLSIAYIELTQQMMPRSIYILSFMFDIIFTGGIRFLYRYFTGGTRPVGFFNAVKGIFQNDKPENNQPYINRIMLVGAGDAGASIIREIRTSRSHSEKVVAVIDDDPNKRGRSINGVKVVGNQADIRIMARRYEIDEIIIAIPSASRKQIQSIVNECNKTKCKVKTLPSLMDLINDKVSVSKLRDVNIEDLLGREPVKLNIKKISDYLEGRIILVTGGGGSIGSELTRQVAKYKPRRLILLDIYENTVFELSNELQNKYPQLELEVVVASITDVVRMKEVFKKYRPHVVFHAAAHKHVPLMEDNPKEAIINNVLGTKILVDLADEYAIQKFIMISTDKAVNPTNVMGATKRLGEMIVQEKNNHSKTSFAAVRFGNVLGSNGSVIPIFRKQIEQGGPVTVTEKNITRYFMTIPEAARLVIQAGALTDDGEIFILDMGEPVKILELAENVIKLSGYIPYEDIDIIITQLRPGEKLHEELLHKGELNTTTSHEKISVGKTIPLSEKIQETLGSGTYALDKVIREQVAYMSDAGAKDWLHEYLPSYVEEKKKTVLRGVKITDE